MPRITLSRRPAVRPAATRTRRSLRRRRRMERELYLSIASRPQPVRDELLEMASRSH